MRKIMFSLLAVAALCSLALAQEGTATTAEVHKAHKAANKPLNNVVKMDADGKRSALCCCGAEFTVTDKAPTMDHDGTLFYLCGDGCKEMAMKSTKAETAKTMADWRKKYKTYKLTDNTFLKDGKTWAKCGCGKEFEVTAESPRVTENGVTNYCCSKECHDSFASLSDKDRMTKEVAMLKPVAVQPSAVGGSK
jgi:hypothetical protein